METINLSDIFNSIEMNKIVLPNFQREFKWNSDEQKKLIASFITKLPIGGLLFLEGNSGDFHVSRIGSYKELDINNVKDECIYLLDGQQRVTSLISVFSDIYKTVDNPGKDIPRRLKNRWFLSLSPKDYSINDETLFGEDLFGFTNFVFKVEDIEKFISSEIEPHIICKSVNLQRNKVDWYLPNYEWMDQNSVTKLDNVRNANKIRNLYANEAAKNNYIPLYALYNDFKLIEACVSEIAENRAKSIISELKDAESEEAFTERFIQIGDNDSNFDTEEISEYYADEEILREKIIEISKDWRAEICQFLKQLLKVDIYYINVQKDEIRRGIAIFENINMGGTPLDNFDLIVAKAAVKMKEQNLTEFIKEYFENSYIDDLRDDFKCISNEWSPHSFGVINKDGEIDKNIKELFLNILSILSHCDGDFTKFNLEQIKRDKILSLTSEQIKEWMEPTLKALVNAIAFFQFRLGICFISEIPYRLMVIPISISLYSKERTEYPYFDNVLEYWYWLSIFAGSYYSNQNQRFEKDFILIANADDKAKVKLILKELKSTREKNLFKIPEYSTVDDFILNKTPSAVNKSFKAYILSRLPNDFLTDELEVKILDENNNEIDDYDKNLKAWLIAKKINLKYGSVIKALKIEMHHIIPLGSTKDLSSIDEDLRAKQDSPLNSILNLTPISDFANKKISSLDFDAYFTHLRNQTGASHFIPEISAIENSANQDKVQEFIERRFELFSQDLIRTLRLLSTVN